MSKELKMIRRAQRRHYNKMIREYRTAIRITEAFILGSLFCVIVAFAYYAGGRIDLKALEEVALIAGILGGVSVGAHIDFEKSFYKFIQK